MLPTPSTSHVPYDLIYEPAEDSFLFLDTLSSPTETAWLRARLSPGQQRPFPNPGLPLLVEIGPGSGVIIAFLTAHAREVFGTDVLSLSVDVNPHAAAATKVTVETALRDQKQTEEQPTTAENARGAGRSNQSVYLSSLLGDLTTPLLNTQVDILVFNPPYVPTESAPEPDTIPSSPAPGPARPPTFEQASKLLELSYAGGLDGMEVTSRLLARLPEVLSPRGIAYVLFCRGNRPDEVKAGIRGWQEGDGWAWNAETVGTSGKTAGWEKLEIVRIWREAP